MKETPVIFRKFSDGNIIAILPDQLGTNDVYTCMSYQHVGQHSACNPQNLIATTKLAKANEYASLLKELHIVNMHING
jgi:hypothetical protein